MQMVTTWKIQEKRRRFELKTSKFCFYFSGSWISRFPIEQRTESSRLFGGTENKQYVEYGI
jgi:hypothetical protein